MEKTFRYTRLCIQCGVKFHTNGFNTQHCSVACSQKTQYEQRITAWKKGVACGRKGDFGVSNWIRKYLFEKYKNKCAHCGWGISLPKTGVPPLEIHHVDNNPLNNEESNLILLCPCCHALTDLFRIRGRTRISSVRIVPRDRIPQENKRNNLECGKVITRGASLCKSCNMKLRNNGGSRPNKDRLIEDLKECPSLCALGRKYNVSDNAVRKWISYYELSVES